MKRAYIYIIISSITVILSVIFLLNGRWIEREEIFGVKIGMDKQASITALFNHGVKEVLPVPLIDIQIGTDNIDELIRLRGVDGICVNDTKLHRSIHAGFNSEGILTDVVEPTAKKFTEFIDVKSKDAFLLQLKKLLSHTKSIVAFSCIVSAKWAKISGSKEDDSQYLIEHDSWTFLEPHGYSQIKLSFNNNKLNQIKYLERKNEPW